MLYETAEGGALGIPSIKDFASPLVTTRLGRTNSEALSLL